MVFLPAHAATDDCTALPEMIFPLADREYPSNAVWTKIYAAPQTHEKFVDTVALQNGRILAVAEIYTAENSGSDIVITEINGRGRTEWEKTHKVPGLMGVRRMIKTKDGAWVLGNRKQGKNPGDIWIGIFDFQGRLKQTRTITDSKNTLTIHDIVPGPKGGFIMAASAQKNTKEKSGTHHPVLYRLDAQARPISHVAFVTGADSEILTLSPTQSIIPGILAAGYMRGGDGRRNGWILGISADLSITWQRQYPRGRGAKIEKIIDYGDDYAIMAGQSLPGGDGTGGGWVMLTRRDSGQVIWQRYFTSKNGQSAKGLIVNDQLISVLLDGPDSPVRLAVLNPRGEVVGMDEFINAQGVTGQKLMPGVQNMRLIAGSTKTTHKIDKKNQMAGPINPKSLNPATKPDIDKDGSEIWRGTDAWLISAMPVDRYEDPCAPKMKAPE